jgi:hypothetical protein
VKNLDKAIKKGTELLGKMLNDYKKEIDKAYLKAGDSETLKVGLSLAFSDDGGNVTVDASLSFIESRIKDSASATVSDQMDLPLGKGKSAKGPKSKGADKIGARP